MSSKKYRLVTRSDFDGLVCAVLLKELNMVREIVFVHPKDMQDGRIPISGSDITANLPYVPAAHLAFDHHSSETLRNKGEAANHIIDAGALSAARVIYDYYGGSTRFPAKWNGMMAAVDKSDAGRFSREEILDPTCWVLLSFLADARTGLGRFHDFEISNYELMMTLIDKCKTLPIETILALPDVRERVELYFDHEHRAKNQIRRCTAVHDNVAVLDLRGEEIIHPVNRFMVYAMYPQANISIHVIWGLKRQNTVFAIGKSILNRSSDVNVGELCLAYGGGGHDNAGTCQVKNAEADEKLRAIVRAVGAELPAIEEPAYDLVEILMH